MKNSLILTMLLVLGLNSTIYPIEAPAYARAQYALITAKDAAVSQASKAMNTIGLNKDVICEIAQQASQICKEKVLKNVDSLKTIVNENVISALKNVNWNEKLPQGAKALGALLFLYGAYKLNKFNFEKESKNLRNNMLEIRVSYEKINGESHKIKKISGPSTKWEEYLATAQMLQYKNRRDSLIAMAIGATIIGLSSLKK